MYEAEPAAAPVSFLNWMIASIGLPYLILLVGSCILCFVLTAILVIRGKGPMSAASLLLIVHAPLFLGVFAALQGAISSYMIIATSASAPKPADVAAGISTALIAPLFALMMMAPSYLFAILGTFFRAMMSKKETNYTSSS